VKPLLESKLDQIKSILSSLVPEKKKRNVLEEAMYEEEAGGFESEVMMQGYLIHYLTYIQLLNLLELSDHGY
jgi:hypothetical protein